MSQSISRDPPMTGLEWCEERKVCDPALDWITDNHPTATMVELWEAYPRRDWMLWALDWAMDELGEFARSDDAALAWGRATWAKEHQRQRQADDLRKAISNPFKP